MQSPPAAHAPPAEVCGRTENRSLFPVPQESWFLMGALAVVFFNQDPCARLFWQMRSDPLPWGWQQERDLVLNRVYFIHQDLPSVGMGWGHPGTFTGAETVRVSFPLPNKSCLQPHQTRHYVAGPTHSRHNGVVHTSLHARWESGLEGLLFHPESTSSDCFFFV